MNRRNIFAIIILLILVITSIYWYQNTLSILEAKNCDLNQRKDDYASQLKLYHSKENIYKMYQLDHLALDNKDNFMHKELKDEISKLKAEILEAKEEYANTKPFEHHLIFMENSPLKYLILYRDQLGYYFRSERIESVLPNLTSKQQRVYVKDIKEATNSSLAFENGSIKLVDNNIPYTTFITTFIDYSNDQLKGLEHSASNLQSLKETSYKAGSFFTLASPKNDLEEAFIIFKDYHGNKTLWIFIDATICYDLTNHKMIHDAITKEGITATMMINAIKRNQSPITSFH